MTRSRFTLRDLFSLTLVAALSVGWWADRNRMQARVEAEIKALESERDSVRTQDEFWKNVMGWAHGHPDY